MTHDDSQRTILYMLDQFRQQDWKSLIFRSDVMVAFGLVAILMVMILVITSYSIHYTKLYDNVENIAHQFRQSSGPFVNVTEELFLF